VRLGYAGIVARPAARALEAIVLIGKEGDALIERQRGIVPTDAAVTVYHDPGRTDPLWDQVARVLRRLGPAEVNCTFPYVAERTRRYMTAGRPPARHTRATVIARLRHDAIRALAHAGSRIPEDVCALFAAYAQHLDDTQVRRACHECGRRLHGDQEVWCSDTCRKRVARAVASPPHEGQDE
jgi:hypothetical protein